MRCGLVIMEAGQWENRCANATVSTAVTAIHEPVCGVFLEDAQNSNHSDVAKATDKHPMLSCAYGKRCIMKTNTRLIVG